MAAGARIFQVLIALANVFILVIGLSMLGMGLIIKPIIDHLPNNGFGQLVKVIIISLIVCGSVMFGSSTMGCFGACYEVIWLLNIYIASMVAVVLMEVGCGIAILVMKEEILNFISDIKNCEKCTKFIFKTLEVLMTPSALVMLSTILIQIGLCMATFKLQKFLKEKKKTRKRRKELMKSMILNNKAQADAIEIQNKI